MLTEWLLVGAGVLLTAGTAVFVAAEFALVTLDPGVVEQDLVRRHDRRGASVRAALRELSTQLSGAQVGITLTTILLGYTAQEALTTILAEPLGGVPAGTLDPGTATLLANSIELGALTAVDVMTDRTRMEVVRRDDTAADVVARAHATGHSRFPVIGESHDDVLGVVHLRRAVAVPYERRAEVPAAALMDEVPRVPETVPLGPLLVELRENLQMAVVVDEYGGTSGVVTLEDVVEEIVGEVADEHDPRELGARRVGGDTWTVPGLLRPDELREQTGLQVPEDPAYETLGGLVMARLGRIPAVGDEVEVPGVVLRVEAMDGRRVERLRVTAREVTG